jgi:hypothetical protein
MVNPLRGEVQLVLDGQPQIARLTLGALAELEAELAESSLADLVRRLEEGRFSSSDIMAVLVAGLRGGGWTGTDGDLLDQQIDGGPLAGARVAAHLIALAFRDVA